MSLRQAQYKHSDKRSALGILHANDTDSNDSHRLSARINFNPRYQRSIAFFGINEKNIFSLITPLLSNTYLKLRAPLNSYEIWAR
ncbi:MAG: hypothetical protein SFU91_12000 [Chloroherpetonaceae bacterium]|nr:hypothetical protein [Chloroherpetonaceae bacterium]